MNLVEQEDQGAWCWVG